MKALSPERWQQINTLLDDLFELPPEQHSAFLEKACAGKPALRRELDVLLATADDAADFFDSFHQNVFAPDETVKLTDPHDLTGSTIRHYTGLAKLGGVRRNLFFASSGVQI